MNEDGKVLRLAPPTQAADVAVVPSAEDLAFLEALMAATRTNPQCKGQKITREALLAEALTSGLRAKLQEALCPSRQMYGLLPGDGR